MGTNVACMYATIYYSYHEECNLQHRSFIRFYRRLIDNAFIIFDPTATDYDHPFETLKQAMNNFGPAEKRLTWDTEKPQTTVNFLDLTVTITPTGTISTKTFQKIDNTYLYRPPTSCQPPSILRSFVYSSLHRYYWQNTNENDFLQMISFLKQRLQARGHRHIDLVPIFWQFWKRYLYHHYRIPDQPITTKKQPTIIISNQSFSISHTTPTTHQRKNWNH